jgi:hypothetical protein
MRDSDHLLAARYALGVPERRISPIPPGLSELDGSSVAVNPAARYYRKGFASDSIDGNFSEAAYIPYRPS